MKSAIFGGHSPPYDKGISNIWFKSTEAKNPPEADKFQRAVALLACLASLVKKAFPVYF
jgi:hypothetical protein